MQDFRRRLREVKTTRWIRFAVVSLLFCGFVVWIGNPWVALLWLLLLDIYITCYIPWTWWKKKSGPVRSVMAWVDAIVYALVLVYIIFAFVGQNYKIPSSSLEKSLLVGDYLWVSKVLYGPRVPQTPLHFPLAQHTLPVIDTKSYIENPQLPYHRLPGVRSIERGDIVVFNYPQGDTVLSAAPNEDYYMLLDQLRKRGVTDPRAFIARDPERFGRLIVRPVDRRENYVKRCVGLPGEWLEIRNDTIFIDGSPIKDADHVQYNYIIPVSAVIPREKWQEIGVRMEDAGGAPIQLEFVPFPFYDVPLTAEARKTVESWPEVSGPLVREAEAGYFDMTGVFPQHDPYGWTRPNMSAFWIPKRGVTLRLTLNNLPLYRRCVEVYEGNRLEVSDGKILINGEDNPYYTFKYDYYWMEGDNRDRSLDSRYWGFVPEDHIVGSPMLVLTSFDQERSLFDGSLRWDRTFINPNPDKAKSAEKGW
ncbi:MAG: signal peptidase I [Bacteroides sp.]|nr:signal peptidase I [Bacteroides sp.]